MTAKTQLWQLIFLMIRYCHFMIIEEYMLLLRILTDREQSTAEKKVPQYELTWK